MRINYKIILSLLGLILILNGVFMLFCLPVSLYYGEKEWMALLLSCSVSLGVGVWLWFRNRSTENKELGKRDGYLIVTSSWLVMSLFGALPYVFSGSIPNYTDAFFETISGFTTTGATILTEIESVPKGILFWRSLTQWVGGMGIIVLTVAILPILGIGGMQLFIAESPGLTPDKLHPRIKETAKRLWSIYLGLTILEAILLKIGGMGFFDAINHSLTTMATGGFSTKNASIAYYDSSFIHYVIVIFMFLAGTNFTLTYFGLNGKFSKFLKNEEFKYYLFFTVGLVLIVTFVLAVFKDYSFAEAFKVSAFQIVSIITTTGFITADYTQWLPFLTVLFVLLMFFGASAGSTSGGVKIVRHLVLVKNSVLEFKRQMHRSAILPVRLNGKAITSEITSNVLAFIIIYFIIFTVSCVIMTTFGVDTETAIGSVATSLANIGPGVGEVGPVGNYSGLPMAGKWFLSFLMLLGRLELFTVLIILSPFFWRKH